MLDLVTSTRRFRVAQPVAAGMMSGLSNDFDDVAIAQLGAKRHDASVDLRAGAGVSDFGVDGIGEVDGTRIARQNDDFALRRECVDLFGIEVDLQRRQKLVWIRHLALPLDYLSQPREALLVLG